MMGNPRVGVFLPPLFRQMLPKAVSIALHPLACRAGVLPQMTTCAIPGRSLSGCCPCCGRTTWQGPVRSVYADPFCWRQEDIRARCCSKIRKWPAPSGPLEDARRFRRTSLPRALDLSQFRLRIIRCLAIIKLERRSGASHMRGKALFACLVLVQLAVVYYLMLSSTWTCQGSEQISDRSDRAPVLCRTIQRNRSTTAW